MTYYKHNMEISQIRKELNELRKEFEETGIISIFAEHNFVALSRAIDELEELRKLKGNSTLVLPINKSVKYCEREWEIPKFMNKVHRPKKLDIQPTTIDDLFVNMGIDDEPISEKLERL